MWCQVQATSALTGAGCPLVRSKHAMCTTADGHIYLYGGRSMANKPLRDLWRFDTAQDVWEEVVPRVDGVQTPQCCGRGAPSAQSSNSYSSSSSSSSSSSASSSAENSPNSGNALAENKYEPPPALQEHTIVAARNKLYLFGGQVGFSSDETPLWIFDLATARWSKFGGGVTHGTSNGGRNRSSPRGCSSVTAQPLGRRAHSAVLYHRAGVMSVYGGYQDFKGSSSELWTFHLERQEWTQEGDRYQKSATPPGRHNHSAVVYKDAMYVYGGMTDLQLRSDFWSWSYKTKKWSRIKTLKNPGELCCHSAIVVADSMFIYGGERGEGQAIAELWRYRFESSTWQQVTVQGMLPGCRTRHAAVAIPFFNFNFNNNNSNNSSDCYDHNQEEETSFIISQHHHHHHQHNHQHHCISPTTTTASQTTQQKDEQTQVEFDFELQPKKSISLCFEQQQQDSHSGMPMSPAEAEPKKKLIRSSKSSSFRRLRSGRDTGAAKSQPQPSILMTTSLPPQPHSQLSTDEGDLITSEETATTGGGDNSSTTTDGGEHQHQQTTLENNQNLLNQKLVSVDISAGAEKTSVRMRPRRPLLTRQRPYSDFYAAGHHRNPHHHQEEFESVNEQLTEKQLKRRSVQESMSYYSLCFPTPPARVAKHRENGDKQQTIEEKDDSKKETVNVSSETLINPQQQQQSSSEVVMRDNSSLKRRMRKANLQLRDLQQNSFSSQSQQCQPPPPTAFTNPAYYSLSLDISPDFEKELPPPPSCHDSMASPINDSDDNDEDDDDDEQLYSFESSEHDPNPHNFQQPQRPQRATTATTTDLDLLEDYLEPEEMLEIVTSTDSLDGDDTSPTLKMRTIAKYHQTPAHKMSSSQQQPPITSNSSNLPPQPPQRKHRTHRAPSVSHSSSGYQSLVLVDGMATTASFDLTSNPSLSNSSSFADHHHHQSAVTTITSSSSSSSASTNQHSSNLDNLARSITLNLRNRTAAQQQQQQRNSFELQELRSPLEQEVVVSRKDGQNTSTNSGHHHRSRSLERSNSSSVEMGGKHHRNAHHHHHHNKPHWQPNITEVIREVIVPRSPALVNQTESRSTTYDSFRNKKSSSNSSRPLVSAFVGRGGRHNGVDNNGVHESWQLCMYVFGGRDGSTGGSVLLNKQPITIWKLYI